MISTSAAQSYGANSTSNINLININQQFVNAFTGLLQKLGNNQNILEFVHNYYANTLKTREFCAALLQQHQHREAIVVEFFNDLACVRRQQLLMQETLQSFHNTFDAKLHRISALKKVSAVFFTAAAAIAAVAVANADPKRRAAAAAAASIVLGAVGNWTHSVLKKHESGVKKHKEIISVMIMGAQFIIRDLTDIHVMARRLQLETESMSSEAVDDEVDVGNKMAALKRSFQELQWQADDYSRDMRWVRSLVLQSIIKNLD